MNDYHFRPVVLCPGSGPSLYTHDTHDDSKYMNVHVAPEAICDLASSPGPGRGYL